MEKGSFFSYFFKCAWLGATRDEKKPHITTADDGGDDARGKQVAPAVPLGGERDSLHAVAGVTNKVPPRWEDRRSPSSIGGLA